MSKNHKAVQVPDMVAYCPDIYNALGDVSTELGKLYPEADMPLSIVELVCVRCSQINGCAACLKIHCKRARNAGVEQTKLDILPSWRSADAFSVQEKAALNLAEAITHPDGDAQAAVHTALEHFAEEQVVALEWAATLINAYNRVSIFSHHQVRVKPQKKSS